MKTIKLSKNPQKDLDAIAYAGQPKANRVFVAGYEQYLSELPVLNPNDSQFPVHLAQTIANMGFVSQVIKDQKWYNDLPEGGFKRSIIAVEDPNTPEGLVEGMEVLIAEWGKGFVSPIHGHANGLLYEDLIQGKIMVNTYRKISEENNTVRLVESKIFTATPDKPVNIIAEYMEEDSNHPRPNLVHNFVVLEPSQTLHYVAEHTRDGRDNGFEVEYYEKEYVLGDEDFERIDSKTAMYSQVGDIILVRSTNVPEFGDHFIIISGPPVLKPHGMRPQDIAFQAPGAYKILDYYKPQTGLILLRLKPRAKELFLDFHGYRLETKLITPQY